MSRGSCRWTAKRALHGSLSELEHPFRAQKCFLWSTGGINLRPGDPAQIEFLLLARDFGIGVRRIATAVPDTNQTIVETCSEEQTAELGAICRFCDLGSFDRQCEHRINDGGIAGGSCAPRFFCKSLVDPDRGLD